MVKPLNKEWALFGPKYRVPDAKGDKVDCKACNKQVSAAVNRLQSHLRVCPAHPDLPPDAIGPNYSSHTTKEAAKMEAPATVVNSGAALAEAQTTIDDPADLSTVVATEHAPAASSSTITTLTHDTAPPAKKPRHSPVQTSGRPAGSVPAPTLAPTPASTSAPNSVANMMSVDDLWFVQNAASLGSTLPPASAGAGGSVLAKKRLELEEKRVLLEIQKDQREQRREHFNLRILEAQARKERLLADKESYDAKVQLALARKRLRDENVSEEEIERLLPIDSISTSGSSRDDVEPSSAI